MQSFPRSSTAPVPRRAQQTVGVLPMVNGAPISATPDITVAPDREYSITWTANGQSQAALFSEQGTPVANDSNDTIVTPAANYTAPVGPHAIVLAGSVVQTITGNNLGDTITSNDTASTLVGGSGNDRLIAGHDANVMTGGAGADIFTFNALPSNAGHITDFATGPNKIDVSAMLASAGCSGSDPFGDGTLSLVPNGHDVTELVYTPPGAGSNGIWPIAVVNIDVPGFAITGADFITASGTSGSGGGTDGGGTGGGGGTPGATLVADNSAHQVLTATGPDATFDAGQNSVVMTEDGGHNNFVYDGLPWNAGEITNFNPASDTIDVGAMLKAVSYSGSDPFGDGTLSLRDDGHGGTDLMYNPPGAGANGIWPITVVDIDHAASASLNTGTDFITGSGTGSGGGTGSGTGGGTGGGTGSGTGGATLTANDTPGQVLTATQANTSFIAGHNSVVMTGDGGANTYIFDAQPWNAGQVTNFNPALDKIDVSGILQAANYGGNNPLGDGTLSLNSDGRGGTELVYNPPVRGRMASGPSPSWMLPMWRPGNSRPPTGCSIIRGRALHFCLRSSIQA